MNPRSLVIPALAVLLLSSCGEEPKTVETVETVKENAIEIVASTKRLPDGRFVMHMHRNFYNKSQLLKQDTLRDTLPNLGMETVTDEETEGLKQVPVEYNMLFKVDTLRY